MQVCSTICVLDYGAVLACGPPDQIRQDPAGHRRLSRHDQRRGVSQPAMRTGPDPACLRGAAPRTGWRDRRLRADPGPPRRRPQGPARGGGGAARSQRGREDHHSEGVHRPRPDHRRRAASRRPTPSTASQPCSWPVSACARSPRGAASSPTCRCARTCGWPPAPGPRSTPSKTAAYGRFPTLGSGAGSWPAPSPAGSSRCSRWPGRSAPIRPCSSSTSCRWAWPR